MNNCKHPCRELQQMSWLLRSQMRNAASRHRRGARAALHGLLAWCTLVASAIAQNDTATLQQRPVSKAEDLSIAPAKVAVQPVARDEEIRVRLQRVMDATGWFVTPKVEVEDGVVFLSGRAESEEIKKWAGSLARNTEDVAAVVNRIELSAPSAWDFRETRDGLSKLSRDLVRSMPFMLVALLILALSAWAGWFAAHRARHLLRGRVRAKLLRGVLAGGLGVLVFLAGTYVVLRVSGLTQLALTVVGGTGLVGLAVGIAFRDITENFLASIFLSMQQPFEKGDLVEIAGVTGYVQQLNVRTTVLMTLEGNLVQIPNATVYKTTLRNFTANPSRRESFVVGIGYEDAIDEAQAVALKVLVNHPAVLKEPEPWVLADDLGKATVNLRIYFWLNGHEHSWLKVRSSVIRLVKRAFQQHGISMPDEAREVVFPHGVPVTLRRERHRTKTEGGPPAPAGEPPQPDGLGTVYTKAEAGLSNDAGVLEEQARQSQMVDQGENLLSTANSARPSKGGVTTAHKD